MSVEQAELVRGGVEAVLMVVDQPVTASELAAALEVPVTEVETALEQLREDYNGYTESSSNNAAGIGGVRRGFELRNLAGGWRIYSRPEHAEVVSRFVLDGQSTRLTQAALETLAVIAYRQPVARASVSAIRGVNVDSVVKTLLQRALIEESGVDPESGALLYRTTSYFLERLGISDVQELPQLSPHLPGLESLGEFYDSSRI
ncbi:SMC-Scp complex subunit ScpB [Pseudarthrobacter sp. J1763]|uniref:SMC-Scp complex subunit ScpB n=1 Tax=Pseudarthrobacter sp. J1763 TaxID=3420445 RepID=UPI003D28CE01